MSNDNPHIDKSTPSYETHSDNGPTGIKKDVPEAKGLLTILKDLAILVSVYLYFTGWVYHYYLFTHFGVSLSSLDIPIYYFFIYSQPVIYENKIWYIFATVIFILILLLSKYVAKRITKDSTEAKKKELELSKWGIISLLVFLLPLSFHLARRTAITRALSMRNGYAQKISFIFKQDANGKYPEEFINANGSGKLRLLNQTKDRFFVFYQPKSEEPEMPYGYSYVVFDTDISTAKIEMPNALKPTN
jgi:hypothetical protein